VDELASVRGTSCRIGEHVKRINKEQRSIECYREGRIPQCNRQTLSLQS
jgi:hypothetical protein